ncbi:MAG: dephospho-CoA kinase [Planctomycetota bacterium]
MDESDSTVARPVIGLAGGVGAGKSAVAAILSRLGCLVCNSDDLAREALRDPAIRTELVGWWDRDILDEAGEIDRAAVARIVFSRPVELKRLESLVHPWIEARRKALFEQAPVDACALVIDAPLLFEAGLDAECDAVIFVDADLETRLARVAEGRGWDEQELGKREDSQLPLDDKRARSDYVVSNNGDLRTLSEQVHRTLNEIIENRQR